MPPMTMSTPPVWLLMVILASEAAALPRTMFRLQGHHLGLVSATSHHSWKHQTFMPLLDIIRFTQKVKWRTIFYMFFVFYLIHIWLLPKNKARRVDQKTLWATDTALPPIPAHGHGSLLRGSTFLPVLHRKSHISSC